MTALMVQGASSSAGKSLLTTALARSLRRRGIDVAPFKAQNMSNNARVVAGGEIGTAQYLQALAAGVEPDVRMNPILIKPEGDNRSQVVVLGKPDLELSRLPWRDRAERLWPVIEQALRSLSRAVDDLAHFILQSRDATRACLNSQLLFAPARSLANKTERLVDRLAWQSRVF